MSLLSVLSFKPFIELLPKSRRKTVESQCRLCRNYQRKMLNLKGNIKLVALDPASRLQQITTDTLTVDLNTQDIFTESTVKSIGSGFTTTGLD